MVTYKEWDAEVRERSEILISSSSHRVFEVGPSETLVIFDVRAPEEDMMQLLDAVEGPEAFDIIDHVKSGLWFVSERSDNEAPFVASWISSDHIDYYDLPAEVPAVPLELDDLEWSEVQRSSIDSGTGCIVGLETALSFREVEGGMDLATETYDDLGTEMVPGGFTFGPHDGGYAISIRVLEWKVVQFKVTWEDDI